MSDTLEVQCNGERVSFDCRLLAKYNVAGPRYTSYPTAPDWSDAFGPDDLGAALEESNRAPAPPLSLYMHLPFCENLCLFCGCNVVISRSHAVLGPYLERLRREIGTLGARLDAARPVTQFHWGGGTPTYLAADELEALFEVTRSAFRFAPDAEIGVEVDPRVTTAAQVRVLRRLGFNRISLGIQDFDPLVQQTVRRVQPYEQTRALFDLCRAEGFSSINVDLIYGLPHQNESGFAATLDRVVGMDPDRIAMFSYAHVPWLKKQQASFARFMPEGTAKFRMFVRGIERLTGAGYRFIGFDHFAKPGDELCRAQDERTLTRNFQGYSTKAGTDLVGVGVSSIGSVGRSYAQNFRELESYYAAVDAGGLATMRGLRMSDDDVLRGAVIRRLLCHCRLPKREIEESFGVRFDAYFAAEEPRLRELERDGLVELGGDEIRVTLLGRLFLRVVGMAFDAYLRKRESTRPLFSQTV